MLDSSRKYQVQSITSLVTNYLPTGQGIKIPTSAGRLDQFELERSSTRAAIPLRGSTTKLSLATLLFGGSRCGFRCFFDFHRADVLQCFQCFQGFQGFQSFQSFQGFHRLGPGAWFAVGSPWIYSALTEVEPGSAPVGAPRSNTCTT
jgi:hypothetical protein